MIKMFRGMHDIPGHGLINVYDFESEVPRSLMGRKVGIVEATASHNLRYGGSSIYMSPNPGPLGIIGLLAIVAIVIGAILICFMLTATSVTQTDDGYYVQVPGAVYWVDAQGNIISQQGNPTWEGITGLGEMVKMVVIGALALGGIYVTAVYILPAFRGRGAPATQTYTQPENATRAIA